MANQAWGMQVEYVLDVVLSFEVGGRDYGPVGALTSTQYNLKTT